MNLFEILGMLLIGPLKLVFEIIFSLAFRITDNPGLGIVVLSLVMNILLLPMYRRADAMQDEARDTDAKLRDGVAHIKKVFSGDERMMILQTYYRQNNYSPLSALNGSLSLLLEIPFFMAAYQVLSSMDIMNNQPFGPILNLGEPDGLLVLGSFTLNLLPILMTAVNLLSCQLYLKGHPLRTKIQLYAMALFFLVFLYDSPACLVLYWTLNNVFSLVKNIFVKLKNPKKALCWICAAIGAALLAFTVFVYQPISLKRKLFMYGLSFACLLPLFVSWILRRLPASQIRLEDKLKPNQKLFLLGALFVTVLTGLLIPGTLIAASPQEFVDIHTFYHPLWHLVSSLCLAAGTFLVWCSVFYYLASPVGKTLLGYLMWILAGVMLVNYMFFGTNLGMISPALQFEQDLSFTASEINANLLVMALLLPALCLVVVKWPKLCVTVLLTATLTMGGMSGLHIFTIQNAVQNIDASAYASKKTEALFRLSKNGKNVVVLMLDRAMGQYLPYIFEEKPELEQQFAGFTYYSNVVSFGVSTNVGVPALVGGYEYTPVEMNRREDERLVDKHNEALKVMPVAFLNEGFEVTVCDPPYADYQWIPNLSIFDSYPEINAYITDSILLEDTFPIKLEKNQRNFFCYSLMKSVPLVLQDSIYADGVYNQVSSKYSSSAIHTSVGLTQATGIHSPFLSWYSTLVGLPELTAITEDPVNTYLFLQNSATHEPQLLQMPDYTLSEIVDNTPYFEEHANSLVQDGRVLKMETPLQVKHYHVNVASLIQLGNWCDYLRENGVYDNTRIIIVSDHGRDLQQMDALIQDSFSIERFFPLMMVKDFGSQEFTTSDAFMTNADVPYLAMTDVIPNPTNPFTGKPITMAEKTAHDQFISVDSPWDTGINNGNVFLECLWASVRDNIWDKNSWTVYDAITVLKEHAAP